MKKNAIVGQSGGPTAVINASLFGVVQEALNHEEACGTVYGMINGIEGLLNGTVMDMKPLRSSGELELIRTTPGAYLGSCRYRLPDDPEDEVYPRIFKRFEEYNIGFFFYIGGNDSMDTVSKLSRYAAMSGSDILILGEPKTIDNDLILTDHTPGFGSAARYVATTVREIVTDASVYDQKAVTIVEIMGRDAGWLTASSALARKTANDNPYLIYLPEADFSTEQFVQDVQNAFEKSPSVVVCVSEGIHDADGTLICEYDRSAGLDSFGHKMLSGCGKYLENLLRSQLNVKARSVELNVCQRCSSMIQSKTDQQEAVMAGRYGVNAILKGETGKMIAFARESNSTYQLSCCLEDVNQICNQTKSVPTSWIAHSGTDVTEEFLNYARPLIQGTVEVPMGEDGLPLFLSR